MYQLIERIHMVQEMVVGEKVPHEFLETTIKKLDERSMDSITRALDDLEKEDANPMQKMMALQAIMQISKAADDLRVFNEVTNRWLNDDTYVAGVGKDGGIVLWDSTKPDSKIAMAGPK